MAPKRLAIFWHSATGGSEALAYAAAKGARCEEGIDVQLIAAEHATARHLLDADGYIFAFPENLAAISGVMKAFFDRAYYSCLGEIEARPFALIICAGSDGSNAMRQAERIATGWRLRKVAEPLIICTDAQTPEEILAQKTLAEHDLQSARVLGASLAAGLILSIF